MDRYTKLILPIFAMLVMLTKPVPSSAQWDGFPLTDNTNARTWWMADAAYQPVSQLWYAVTERCLITGGFTDEGVTYQDELVAFNGVTGTIFYTTTNLFRTNAIAPNLGFGETSWIGPMTNTVNGTNFLAYPWLRGEFLAYLMTAILWDENIDNGANEEGLLHGFVATEYELHGDYDLWFQGWFPSGGTGTPYPENFPMLNMQYVIWTNDIGFSTNLSFDSWGHPYVSSESDDDNGFMTIYIGATSDVTLVEHHYTSEWYEVYNREFYNHDGPLDNIYNTSEKPHLLYHPASSTQSLSVSIYGWGIEPLSLTRVETSQTSIAVNTGTVDVVLDGWWHEVTNLVVSGSPGTTDVVTVTYRKPVTIYEQLTLGYDPLQPDEMRVLSTEILDESYAIISEMIYTTDSFSSGNFPTSSNGTDIAWTGGSGNKSIWSGSSAISWALATTAADAATPSTSTAATEPARHYTVGSYSAPTWTATRTQVISAPDMEGPGVFGSWTNFARSIDIYLRGTKPVVDGVSSANAVYDDFGTANANEFYFELAQSIAETSTESVTGNNRGGGTHVWAADPQAVGAKTSLGYILDGRGLFKYNGANGFTFK